MRNRLVALFLVILVISAAQLPAGESAISESDGQQSSGSDYPSDCTNYKVVYCDFCECLICEDGNCDTVGFRVPKDTDGDSFCSSLGGTLSQSNSVVDNITFNHIHDAVDWEVGKPPTGCVTCGGAAPKGATGIPLMVRRYHRYRDITEHSSFGPGVFSGFDLSLTLAPMTVAAACAHSCRPARSPCCWTTAPTATPAMASSATACAAPRTTVRSATCASTPAGRGPGG